MLPAMKIHRPSLADVMPSCLDSLLARPNTLGLPRADGCVVLVVDGLGAESLHARAGHARTLAPLLTARSTITSGFPTTTAAALATLATGVAPGTHGLVGYTVLDTVHDRIMNQLTGWDGLDPARWQRSGTVFERAAAAGVGTFSIGPERFRDSGFTAGVLRGARYRSAETIADRLDTARLVLDSAPGALIYVYVPELDLTAHAIGWESTAWTDRLELVDAVVKEFVAGLHRHEGLLVTADHGMLDVPHRSHVLFDSDPALVDGIRFVAGDPRCLQLHFEPDATSELRERVLERWRESESTRAWVLSRAEAIAAGWFGAEVHADVRDRIGDIVVAARKRIAYYDSRTSGPKAQNMVGQHGSWTSEEVNVPLLRFGAYALLD